MPILSRVNNQNIIIFGVSKIAEIIYSYIQEDCIFNIVGFCVDREYLIDDIKFGLPVVAFDDIETFFPPTQNKMLVAIGYHALNSIREQKCTQAREKGYQLVNYIHKKATVASTAKIGDNCIILDNVSIGPYCEIGNNVSLYCNTTVAHHSKIEQNVWVTSGTVIGGNTCVGKNTFLGINSTIGHNIKIGQDNFIGAGAIVTKSTDDKAVYIHADTPKYKLNSDQFLKLFHFD